MTRVLIGDALVNEDERLQARINQLQDRLETTLKQALRFAVSEKHNQIVYDFVDCDTAKVDIEYCAVDGRTRGI